MRLDQPFGMLSSPSTENMKYSLSPAALAIGATLALGAGAQAQSLIYNLGADVSYAASTRFGVVSPYVGMEWAHQFLDDPRIPLDNNAAERYHVDYLGLR